MTSPALDAQHSAVISAYQQQTAAVRDQLTAYMVALWASLPDYQAGNALDFTAQAVPVVQGAMSHMQAVTAAYLATLIGLTGGSQTPEATPTIDIAAVRAGTAAAEVYARPFHLVWRRLHEMAPVNAETFARAVKSGEDRAVQLAVTDVQLAKTHTSRDVLASDRSRHVVGYRRLLEGPHSCGLCVVASTARYHKAELMPMHPGCDCSVAPIIGDADPRPRAALEAAHAAVADRFGADSTAARDIRGALTDKGKPVLYRDVLITHQHHEIGPVLAVRGQKFSTVH